MLKNLRNFVAKTRVSSGESNRLLSNIMFLPVLILSQLCHLYEFMTFSVLVPALKVYSIADPKH